MTAPPSIALRAGSLLALAAIAVLAWSLLLDGSAVPEVTRYRDDAYYYFDFVRALARGEGPCVTPGEPTNGIHAAWAVLLWPLYAWFGERGCTVGAAHLGLGLHALTALLLFFAAGKGLRAAAVALIYLGCPTLIVEAQNGQETALACLATALCLLAFARGLLPACLAASFALLARSDLICLVAPLGLAQFGWRWRAGLPALCGLAALTAVNLLLAGRPVQDSALPIPWLFAQHFERSAPDLAARAARLWWYLRPCLFGGPFAIASWAFGAALLATAASLGLRGRARLVLLPLALLAIPLGASDLHVPIAAGGLLVLAVLWRETPAAAAPARFAWLTAGAFALCFLHLVLRTYPRDYYFAPLGVLGAAALLAWSARVGVVGLALVAVANLLALRAPPVEQRWQEQMAMAGRFLRTVLPAGEPVGCFNSGILAWHDPGPVLNLDGVVNHAAFAALRAGRLDAYLDDARVRFLVDSAIQFRRDDPWPHCSGTHFGPNFDPDRDLIELARCVAPDVPEPFLVYWRRGRGAPPTLPSLARDLGPAPAYGERRAGRYALCPCPAGALWLRRLDGEGQRLLTRAERATVVLLRADAPTPGRYGLFADGDAAPRLLLEL